MNKPTLIPFEILPQHGLAFREGQIITTNNDRPEGLLCTVEQAAAFVMSGLTDEAISYAGARGGFGALHDLCDANMILPGADCDGIFDTEERLSVYTDFANAVMDEVSRRIIATATPERPLSKGDLVTYNAPADATERDSRHILIDDPSKGRVSMRWVNGGFPIQPVETVSVSEIRRAIPVFRETEQEEAAEIAKAKGATCAY